MGLRSALMLSALDFHDHCIFRIEDMLGWENLKGGKAGPRLRQHRHLYKLSKENWSRWCKGLSYTI